MRLGLLLLPLLLAGCMQPTAQGPPPSEGRPPSLLPPSLLIDRSANGTVQVYVHAKQGNVRYDWVNLTLVHDLDPTAVREETRPHAGVYAVDADLGRTRVNLTVVAVEGGARYAWAGEVTLNDTLPARAVIAPRTEGGPARAFNATLPFETYLARAEAGP